MKIFNSLEALPPLKDAALSIGTFDALHLGHQKLFQELKKRGTPTILTFSNHPLEILNPSLVPAPVLSLSEKLELLEIFDIEIVIILPFTKELSQTPYDLFIKNLHTALPFSSLILGEDARLGANASGGQKEIALLAKTVGFEAVFLPKMAVDNEHISSSQIRQFIQNQQLDKAKEWLGHNKGLLCLSPVDS